MQGIREAADAVFLHGLQIEPLLTHVLPLDQAAEAFEIEALEIAVGHGKPPVPLSSPRSQRLA